MLCGSFVCDGVPMLRIGGGVVISGEGAKLEVDSGCQTIALPRFVVENVL